MMWRHLGALVASPVLALAALPVQAADLISCTSQNGPEITISLHSRKAFGRDLSCISGKFVADLTPCAPAGGFGLSTPTGDARLVGVEMDWRELSRHFGGVTSFLANESSYTFIGGHKPYDRGITEEWRFVASRTSGEATLTLNGRSRIAYKCRPSKQRF